MEDVDSASLHLLGVVEVKVEGAVLPPEWFRGTRFYLEKLCHQINGAYEYGFYDASAVLSRRLIESLIIDVYVHKGIHHEIKPGGTFLMLDGLITHIRNHKNIVLSRNAPKSMEAIKQLGDTAAHDRTYITQAKDLDDAKASYRRLIQELLTLAGMMK